MNHVPHLLLRLGLPWRTLPRHLCFSEPNKTMETFDFGSASPSVNPLVCVGCADDIACYAGLSDSEFGD